MMYLWPQTSPMAGMSESFGVMTRPSDKTVPRGILEGRIWAMDNECFTRPFDWGRWLAHWQRLSPYAGPVGNRGGCMFLTVPDVVGDAAATLALWREWAPRIYEVIAADYPLRARTSYWGWLGLAYVAQDGAEDLPFPDEAGYVFIGGTTGWKMSPAADAIIRRAFEAGLFVHVGRVNSQKRIRHFQYLEVGSVDGTFPCREPDTARRRLTTALEQIPLVTGQPCHEPGQE